MNPDFSEYKKAFADEHTVLSYNGPLWSTGIYGIAEMFRQYLDLDGQPSNTSLAIFAVFIEQLNNMMMHSAERVRISHPDGEHSESPKGSFLLGNKDGVYFLYSGNYVTSENADILKERINSLNQTEKKELMKGYKFEARNDDENESSDSKGAGIGLYEIALRASSKIEYEITTHQNGKLYFNMYVTV